MLMLLVLVFPSGVLVSHGTRIFQVSGINGTVVAATVAAAAVITLLRLAEKRIGHFFGCCNLKKGCGHLLWTTIACLN